MHGKSFLAAASVLIALTLSPQVHAQARPTLSGTWSASGMSERWSTADWGPKCGPRPSPQGSGGGTVTITQSGYDWTMTGAGRGYSTTNCWEQAPGLSRTSHSASSRGWSNRCTTAANDPRRAVVVTTISATDDAISFQETGNYQFQLEGQLCSASVMRSRSFKLLQRQGEAPPPVEPPPTPPPATTTAAPPEPPPTASTPPIKEPALCATPGQPARVEVRPSFKLLRPGDEFAFTTRVFDASGCAVKAPVTWRAAQGIAKVRIDQTGTIVVDPTSPEGSVDLFATVSGQNVKVTVEVASADRYDALLATGGLNERGEKEDAAVAGLATGGLGGGASFAEDGARKRKWIFAAVVGGLASILAAAGLVMLRKGSKAASARRDDDGAIETDMAREFEQIERVRPRQRLDVSEMGGDPSLLEMRCPVCGQDFPAGGLYCPTDGTRLMRASTLSDPSRSETAGFCPTCERGFPSSVKHCPEHHEALIPAPVFNVSTARKQQPFVEKKGKICPTCGSRYDAESTFCGKDGTALVIVN